MQYWVNVLSVIDYLNLRTIREELSVVAYKWYEIGIQLGIPTYKLKEFEKKADPLTEVIDYWLKGNVESVPVNWKSIVNALKSSHVDESGRAKRIELKYCRDGKI